MADQKIKCKDCGTEFTFSEKDQSFYKEKGYKAPQRCKACRDIWKKNNPR